jgi:chromosome partitioning protein
MTIFTMANTKGGVGKSTMTIQVATGLSLNDVDNRVWVVDGDKKQTSALLALTNRMNSGSPGIAATELSEGATLRAQVKLQAGAYDHVVIDVGARDSSALRAALAVTDVLMVPFAPRSFDLWAYENMIELVKEAQGLRDVRVMPFLNMADPQGGDNDSAVAQVEEYGFPVSKVRIGNRKAIERASAAGLNVSEYKPVDVKARDEVAMLVRAMLELSNELR